MPGVAIILDESAPICHASVHQGVPTLNENPRKRPARRDASPRNDPTRTPDPRKATALEALLDLAYDVSSYLRRSARPGVRVAAALLLASSLAACSPSGALDASSIVSPLSQEVRRGLPTAPGRYALDAGTLGRDSQGVYYFAWRQLTDPVSVQHFAALSRLRLSQAPNTVLEIPAS